MSRVPFIDKLSYKLCNTIPVDRVSFYNNLTLGKLLFNSKDIYDDFQRSGVYEIKCKDCDCKYIGQTGRKFHVRMKEHRRDFINNDGTTGMVKHLIDENHWCDFDPQILHFIDKGLKLDFVEQFEIINSPADTKLCNDNMFLSPSPLLRIRLPPQRSQR